MSRLPDFLVKPEVIACGITITALLGAGAALAYENANMRSQLVTSTATVASQNEQLKTAATEITSMTGQLRQLAQTNSQLVDNFAAQQRRLDAIDRHATALAVKLEATTHEDPDAKAWGDTLLPAAVARLLDNTGEDPAGAGPQGADQSQAGDLPAGDQRP